MSTAHDTTTPPGVPGPRPWSTDPYADALVTGRGPLFLRRTDGWLLPLEVERWCARADAVDLTVLARCEGTVLDVGCGPGRLVAELAARGRPALGIDVSEAAVEHTARLGGQALRRSVFEPLPGEGRWDTALLLDGNVGIGGDPAALLRRVSQLLAPAGLLIVETLADVDVDERVSVDIVRVTDPGARPGRSSRGPASAPRRCSGTRHTRAGAGRVSGRPGAARSSPCATATTVTTATTATTAMSGTTATTGTAAGRAAPPSPRTAPP